MKIVYNLNESKKIDYDIKPSYPIGVLLSGGPNSALLLYLITKLVKESKLDQDIYLISAEKLGKPNCLRFAQRVRENVEDLFDLTYKFHFNYILPSHCADYTPTKELEISQHYLAEFSKRYHIGTYLSGETASIDKAGRNPNPFQAESPLLVAPFKNLTKRDIAELYQKENLVENLLPITRSCEAGTYESDYFRKTCNQFRTHENLCFSCKEKEIAFPRT